MEKRIKQYIKVLLVALVPLAFTACEINGPMSHYEIVVNEQMTFLPIESILEVETVNREFAAVPCEKVDAIERFDKFCNNLQNYYDEKRGALIWGDLNFDVCLYNKTNYNGKGEGLLVKSRVITYRCE